MLYDSIKKLEAVVYIDVRTAIGGVVRPKQSEHYWYLSHVTPQAETFPVMSLVLFYDAWNKSQGSHEEVCLIWIRRWTIEYDKNLELVQCVHFYCFTI